MTPDSITKCVMPVLALFADTSVKLCYYGRMAWPCASPGLVNLSVVGEMSVVSISPFVLGAGLAVRRFLTHTGLSCGVGASNSPWPSFALSLGACVCLV